jgi:hypothetical protein
MLALRERFGQRRADLFLVELGYRIATHGIEPRSDVVMHVAGNVSDAEWEAAVTSTGYRNATEE